MGQVLNEHNLQKLITEALAIEAEEAKNAGSLGYMARSLVQATMPHKNTAGSEFTRTNGAFVLSILTPSQIGLPYGNIPRLLLAWLSTEAVLKKSKHLCLGNTLSSFMQELGLVPTGGRWGSITRLREQTKRLFSSTISCHYKSEQREHEQGFRIADSHDLWWFPKSHDQPTLFESTVTLSDSFFNEITTRPVPIDLRALKALKRSPMALDIYCWLTYRMSYLSKQTQIPWGALKAQFGADYSRERDFKKYFLTQLRSVHVVYSDAKVEPSNGGLILRPSKTHASKKLCKT